MGLLVNHAQPKCLVRAPQGAGEAKHPPSINGIQILPRTCWKFQSLKGCVRACLLPYTHGCYYFGAEYPTKDYHMVVGGSNLPPPKTAQPFPAYKAVGILTWTAGGADRDYQARVGTHPTLVYESPFMRKRRWWKKN